MEMSVKWMVLKSVRVVILQSSKQWC